MNVPKGLVPKNAKKNLIELLEDISNELKEKRKSSEEPYIKKVWCPYLGKEGGEVLLKLKETEVIEIKCRNYREKGGECIILGYETLTIYCYLMEDWSKKGKINENP